MAIANVATEPSNYIDDDDDGGVQWSRAAVKTDQERNLPSFDAGLTNSRN